MLDHSSGEASPEIGLSEIQQKTVEAIEARFDAGKIRGNCKRAGYNRATKPLPQT